MRKILIALALMSTTAVFADTPAKKDDPAAKKDAPKADKSLYDRLGGKDAITKVVHEFVGNVVADKRINKFFAKTDGKKLEGLLVDQVCEATGGPCKYKGKNMADAHKGMKITDADFTALVEDLTKALDKFKVPDKEKGELLGALGGMKGDIVAK
jgi:hemoglobin